jgi:hypothetical protein
MGKKTVYVCRLGFLKYSQLQIDVWGWAEINVNWLLVKQSDKLEYRCNEWLEDTEVITANNNTIKDHMKLKRHTWGVQA